MKAEYRELNVTREPWKESLRESRDINVVWIPATSKMFYLLQQSTMKPAIILLCQTASVFATIYNTNLYVNSTDPSVDGLYITGKFENSTLYFLLGDQKNAVPISYDDQQKDAWVTTNNHSYFLQIDDKDFITGNQTRDEMYSPQFINMNLGPNQDKEVYMDSFIMHSGFGVDPDKTQQYVLLLDSYSGGENTKKITLYANIIQYNGTATILSGSSSSDSESAALKTSAQSSQVVAPSNDATSGTPSGTLSGTDTSLASEATSASSYFSKTSEPSSEFSSSTANPSTSFTSSSTKNGAVTALVDSKLIAFGSLIAALL